jgi:hypothetical protein
MGKAEKFISDYTRNCSNVVAYSGMIEDGKLRYHEWLTPDQALRAVEIAREEMIERISVWAKTHTCMFKSVEEVDLYNQLLIKAMKDE